MYNITLSSEKDEISFNLWNVEINIEINSFDTLINTISLTNINLYMFFDFSWLLDRTDN